MDFFSLRFLTILGIATFFVANSLAQSPVESLYARKCKADETTCETQEIVRYDFHDGELKLRTIAFTSQTSDIRFDAGGNRIVDGSILLNRSGSVIDLRNGKVLFRRDGQLVAVIGSVVVIDYDNVKGDDLYTFDLKTHAKRQIKSRKDIEDLDRITSHISPNGKLVAKWKGGAFPRSAFDFFAIDKSLTTKRIRSVLGGFSGSCSMRCSDMNRTPFVWVDNYRLLTQRENGDLVTIDTAGKVRNILKIEIDEEPDSIPSFGRDRYGNIFYYCDGTEYLIDIKNKTFSTNRLPLGHGFSKTNGDTFSTEYFYKGDSIGTAWSVGALATKNYLAVIYAADGKNLGYPDGFKVWNRFNKKWLTIDESWGFDLIDWVY